MTDVTTHVKRDNHGNWTAKSEIEMGGARVLRISTYKTSNGALLTSASVQHRTHNGFLTFAVFKDYSKVIFRGDARCTSKNVELQHAKALEMLDAIRIDAANHYEPEPATTVTT